MILLLILSKQSLPLTVSFLADKKYSMTLESTYQQNKKVWGAYNLIQKKVFLRSGNTTLETSQMITPESILFKNRNLFLVKSILDNQGRSTMKVKFFPYRSEHGSIIIDLEQKQDYMKELFSNQIERVLNNEIMADAFSEDTKLIEKQVSFQKIICKKQKAIINCTYHMDISVPIHTETVQM